MSEKLWDRYNTGAISEDSFYGEPPALVQAVRQMKGSTPASSYMKRATHCQVVLDWKGLPLPRDARALHDDDSRRQAVAAANINSPTGAGVASVRSPPVHDGEDRGGASAAASYRKGAKKADWAAILTRVHACGQCNDCEEASDKKVGSRCPAHRARSGKDATRRWWHEPQGDPGLALLNAEALARERAALKNPNSGWRSEWREVRAEQLYLQGEQQLAAEERMGPGRPESVEWVTSAFEPQISALVREEGWSREQAVGYSLLSCGGVAALARAARGEEGPPLPVSRGLIASTLLDRVRQRASEPRAAPVPGGRGRTDGR